MRVATIVLQAALYYCVLSALLSLWLSLLYSSLSIPNTMPPSLTYPLFHPSRVPSLPFFVPLDPTYPFLPRIFLHWAPHASTIDFALEATKASGASTGWLAVGWSTDSQMIGSDAVVGNLPGNGVAAYYLGDENILGFEAEDHILAANSYGSTATATGTLIW